MEIIKYVHIRYTCWVKLEQLDQRQLSTFQVLGDIPKELCLIALAVRFSYVLVQIIKERVRRKRQHSIAPIVRVLFCFLLHIDSHIKIQIKDKISI